jgi:hypothetical protein
MLRANARSGVATRDRAQKAWEKAAAGERMRKLRILDPVFNSLISSVRCEPTPLISHYTLPLLMPAPVGRSRTQSMNAQELADKFMAKVADAVVKKDEQTSVAADNKKKRLDDAGHCKRQLAEAVIPFLDELQSKLPEQFTFAPQIDLHDHKFVGVSFRIGDGPVTTISTPFGNVTVTRTGDSGSSKGTPFVYPPDAEPYISNSGDLTRDKIAKLVEMTMDNE